MPLIFAISFNSHMIDLAFLQFEQFFSFNKCLLLALSCAKFDNIVRHKRSLKHIPLAKHIYVVFY